MESISTTNALKAVQSGLSQTVPSATQSVMLFNSDGTPGGKCLAKGISSNADELLVDLALPSGTIWATRNLDISQPNGFALSPYQYECTFVSWGNTEGHNPISTSAFDYNWGSSNDGPYASTHGATLTADFKQGDDIANVCLGDSWRMPTTNEFKELFDNCDFVAADGTTVITDTNKLITLNGVVGIYLKSKNNGKHIFFACSGNGNGTSWISRGSGGYYWSSSLYSATNGRNLDFHSGGINPRDNSSRFYGFAVRPVQNRTATGGGYGTCTTDATTAAKTASVGNFNLAKNASVSVLFTKAVSVANATMNIDGTGAKPIFYMGAALQQDIIHANSVVTLLYDGTNYNVTSIVGQERGSSSDLFVDMGLPSGVKWARKNLDMSQDDGFAQSEYQYECSFISWGNTEVHNPSSTSAFDYNWGSANDGPYAGTPGAALTANASVAFDAARANLGAPWRLPTTEEFAELFNSSYTKFIDADGNDIAAATTDKRITMNGIVGIRLMSKVNGNILFFACSGYGGGASWYYRGSVGYYWSSSLYSATNGRYLYFYSGGVYPQNYDNRFNGFAVRPVQ